MKKILSLLFVFCLGVAGGIWAQVFLLPALAANPALQNIEFVKNWNAKIQIVRPIQQIFVNKDTATQDAIASASKVAVAVQTATGDAVLAGSGLIFTSDGLIATLATLVPEMGNTIVFLDTKESAAKAQVIKRDLQKNLALLKIEKTNLPTASFSNLGGVVLGSQVFLVGKTALQASIKTIANQGIVRSQTANLIETTIYERPSLAGSPLFDSQGNIVGLVTVAGSGQVAAIPLETLRSFLGL